MILGGRMWDSRCMNGNPDALDDRVVIIGILYGCEERQRICKYYVMVTRRLWFWIGKGEWGKFCREYRYGIVEIGVRDFIVDRKGTAGCDWCSKAARET